MRTMIKDKKVFLKLYLISVLALFILIFSSSYVSAACDTTYTSTANSINSNGITLGFYGFGKPDNCNEIYTRTVVNTFVTDSTSFTEALLADAFKYQPASPSTSYANPVLQTLNGGLSYVHYNEATFRAGVYLYGQIYSPTFKLTGGGTAGQHWFDKRYKPDVYLGANLYELSDWKNEGPLTTLMVTTPSSSVFVNTLLSKPVDSTLHMYVPGGYYADNSATLSLSAYRNGVYFLALAGGNNNRNSDWQDIYTLEMSVSGSYVASPRLLTSYSDIRNAFSAAGKSSLFDSNPTMCNLIGDHVYDYGFNTQPGKIMCCGKSDSSDLGQTNLQYICRVDGNGKYYWKNVCELTGLADGSTEKTLYDAYCQGCNTPTTGRCQGDTYSKQCSGTFTCQYKSESDCKDLSAYCNWKTTWSSCGTEYATYSESDSYARDYYSKVSESFDALTPRNIYESLLVYPDGSVCVPTIISQKCEDNTGSYVDHSCSVYNSNLQTCSDTSGCHIQDLDGHNTYITSKCSDFTYDVAQCASRSLSGCSWGCRADLGKECSTNDDCITPYQCDADFTDAKRCHATDSNCVIGPYLNTNTNTYYTGSTEVSSGTYVCANKEYKRCDVTTTSYSSNLCGSTSALGFVCAGSPYSQTCFGTASCYGLSLASCNSLSGCSWVQGPSTCEGSYTGCIYYDSSDCGTTESAVKDSLTRDVTMRDKGSFAAAPTTGSCSCLTYGTVYCSSSTQATCEAENSACTWTLGSYYCSGSHSCSVYNSNLDTCSGVSGCSIFPPMTTCSGNNYGSCSTVHGTLTGCVDQCVLPKFGTATNVNNIADNTPVNSEACKCAGGQILSCYPDVDKDGFAVSSGAITRCIVGTDSFIDVGTTRYYCGDAPSPEDCSPNDNTLWQTRTVYRDADNDGVSINSPASVCMGKTSPTGYAMALSSPVDCDDSNSNLYLTMNGYPDADADGYYSGTIASVCTNGALPSGYSSTAPSSADCLDSDSTVHPGATEICDGKNNDCVGTADDATGFECVFGNGCVNYYGVCRWQDCSITIGSYPDYTLTIAPNCYYDTTKSEMICTANGNDGANLTFSFSGSHCNLVNYIQVDFMSDDGSCTAQYTGGLNSIMSTTLGTFSNTQANTPVLTYKFSGAVNTTCAGKALTKYAVSLRSGIPSLGTTSIIRSNIVSGKLSTSMKLAQCTLKGYIPYASKINFAESPTFLVPNTTVAITSLCKDYTNNSVNVITASGEQIVQITGVGNYVCDKTSDGVCPNDFVTTPLCPVANGYSNDSDCGTHLKVTCLDVYNSTGVKTGSTCTTATGTVIQGPTKVSASSWCGLQNTLTSATQLHAQCTTGAVVQDPNTGCPICLAPGANVTYTIGVTKYVPTQADPIGRIDENLTLVTGTDNYAGVYPVCPKDYYYDSMAKTCFASPARCDEGYRTTTTNNLIKGCDRPATYNPTTGKWTLNTNCLYKNAQNQYTTYCGLESWYNNYEIYEDTYKIVVI